MPFGAAVDDGGVAYGAAGAGGVDEAEVESAGAGGGVEVYGEEGVC